MTKAMKTRKVLLADGRSVTLTTAQVHAIRAIAKAGDLYSYNGVSRTTVAVLERLGLVTVEWKTTTVETSHGYRGVWRSRAQIDWVARINPSMINRSQDEEK